MIEYVKQIFEEAEIKKYPTDGKEYIEFNVRQENNDRHSNILTKNEDNSYRIGILSLYSYYTDKTSEGFNKLLLDDGSVNYLYELKDFESAIYVIQLMKQVNNGIR